MGLRPEKLENQLNTFDPARRKEALAGLVGLVKAGEIALPEPGSAVNLHCHTFFSYNGYGYSPTFFAWKARREGLAVAGVVDFDVLDAVDEFLEACGSLGLKGCAGVETRIFLPQYETREINSPGEPGIAYHMAEGFATGAVGDKTLLNKMRALARNRTIGILERVNPYFAPAEIDYERDVLPRTPKGNATERHLCEAYEAKAAELFDDLGDRATFWAEKLGTSPEQVGALFADSPTFQGLIRSTTMKRGGVGYVKPEPKSFPTLDEVNALALANGAIPTYTWLDGTSDAERDIEALLDLHMAAGTAAINIIPDRNWNVSDPDLRATKVAKLGAVVEIAQERGLPVVVGTEMNAYGQRFVDAFDAPELEPHAATFLKGAHIIYAHTLLQAEKGMGYLSDWANGNFASANAKNDFFRQVGEALSPGDRERLASITPAMSPAQVLAALGEQP
ncbi:MAG TPA: hypothetical protein HPP83_13235 [Candidatus Hydrogenedentes bacterium]|nr:hypothetical protein [Candidatus Hydrogenedentota bacterium]